MERDFAILVINACYRASREIGEIGTMAKKFAPGEEGKEIKSQVGFVISEIGRITDSVFMDHPDLKDYVENQINKFGKVS